MSTGPVQAPHGSPRAASSSFFACTTSSTPEILSVRAVAIDASVCSARRLTPLSALDSPHNADVSVFSKAVVPALVELQRLRGNEFSLRQAPAPWSCGAAVGGTDAASNAASRNHAISASGARAATTITATPMSRIMTETSPRAGWLNRTPLSATEMTVQHTMTTPNPWARRCTTGGASRDAQATRSTALLQPRGRRRSFSESTHAAWRPSHREHPSNAQNALTATYTSMPPGILAETAAQLSSLIPPAPHSVHEGSRCHSGGTPMAGRQLSPTRTRSVAPQMQQLRDGGGNGASESAGEPLPRALATLSESFASTSLYSGLSSPLPSPPQAPTPPFYSVVGEAGTLTQAHVAVDRVRTNATPQLPSSPATQAEALCRLLQQYIDAQRALNLDVLQQLRGDSEQLALLQQLQELVLRHVRDFALQLDAAAHLHAPPYQRPAVAAVSRHPGAATGMVHPLENAARQPPLLLPAAHKGDNVPWGTIFHYLSDPPMTAHAALCAVAPASRRRLEQLRWRWMIAKVATDVCPFIQEHGAEADMRDAYARLDGQERPYAGSVPVARLAPQPLPYRRALTTNQRLRDGSALLDCERQSLLLDRAWREGWLHRLGCSYHAFVLPRLSGCGTVPSRIRVDGIVCDVLRPKGSRLGGGDMCNCRLAGACTASAGALGISTDAVCDSRLAPLPPPMPEKRPTEALCATRKLLDDAGCRISRELARGADASLSTQSHVKLTPYVLPTSASTVTSSVDSSLIRPPQEGERSYRVNPVTGLQRHPHYGHASLPVLVEDVSGTAHLLCTSETRLDRAEVWEWASAWLQHRHRLPRQPICSSAAEFLLVRSLLAPLRAVDDGVDEADYAVSAAAAAVAPWPPAGAGGTRHPASTRLGGKEEAVPRPPLLPGSVASPENEQGEEGYGAAMPGLAFTEDASMDSPHILNAEGLARVVAVGEAEHAGNGAPVESHFRVRLQDWCGKLHGVVRRMNDVDPPRRMLGNASGPQPRPLALHLTEQHIPWLAQQLCPDSEGGGLVDLQELHLSVTESLLPPGWAASWRWCLSVLRCRKNLLVLSVVTRPWARLMSEGASSDAHVDVQSHDPAEVIGVLGTSTARAAMFTAPLQVLSLQGAVAEAVAPLFCGVSHRTRTEVDGDGVPPALERLRELYVSVRSGQSAGGSVGSVGLGDVHVTASVYPALQVLWLDAPRLRRVYIDHLLMLRELHLISGAPLACSALRGVELLPHLEVLHLEKAIIDDCALFGECLALRELLLHACRLSLLLSSSAMVPEGGDEHLEELHGVERAPRLETLSLCYTDEVRNLQNFSRCRSLRRVLLTRCNGISSSSVAGLERLPRLELLAMEYTRVSALSHFAASPALRVLRLDGCKRVLRSSVVGLEAAAFLTELSLKETNVSTVANFGGGCHALRSLDLSGCRHLDVDGLQGIQALPQLEILSLSRTRITDVRFLSDCLRLTALYLEGCTELMPTSLEGLEHAPRLRQLVANGCPTLTRVGRLGKCAALEVFAVAGAAALTTEGVQGIEQGRYIQYLDLSCTAVSTLHFLVGGCCALRYLSVKACGRITTARSLLGIEELPQLEVLNMEDLNLHGRLDFLATSTSLRYVSYAGCTGLSTDDVQALRQSGVQSVIP
ncbi:hypothetical protein CUR178_01808 [Leishmania enriettii]|uniref:Leucine-rich repeat protein n=1 Tax=Leishmania enriettii TaxID=5663 RepID=A0A836KG95_LEIEN|nr:hypothetical protein CUR178_01808 [Leishmania enriettii]